MYIERIKLQNYGTIEQLDIQPKFDENGNPLPLILIGKNGSGKTLLLSNILDSFIEFRKIIFNSMPEIENNKLLKIGSKTYISTGKDFLYTHISYQGTPNSNYTDFTTKIPAQTFRQTHPQIVLEGINLENSIEFKDGFYRKITPNDKQNVEKNLNDNVLMYFPHSRYDHPEWLNNNAELGFKINQNYLGETHESIIKDNVIQNIVTWLLDCLLDKYIYERTEEVRPVNIQKDGVTVTEFWTVLKGYSGRNENIINMLNELLTSIYALKYPSLEHARIGVSQKNKRQISIIIKEKDKSEIDVVPSFKHLSSGEVMLLSLFGSLIREYDKMGFTYNNLSEIKGIVVIDEIDLHLHIEHQKILLPKLISMFPKVQFVVTTHSPFFLLGMNEKFKDKFKLINMPFGNEIEVNEFSEVQEAYNIFVGGFNQLQKTFKSVQKKLESITRPIIITEGKTDWKHLKSALLKLQAGGMFLDLPDFEFLEFEDDIEMSSSHLKSYCLQRAKFSNEKKIICIFDRDEADYVKSMGSLDPVIEYKDNSNNVFSFCIPKPNHRLNHELITIEHYYTDEEIKTKDENSRRVFLSSEFSQTGAHKTLPDVRHGNYEKIKRYTDENKSKIIEYDVFCGEENIALPKSDFAKYIYENKSGFDNFNVDQFEKIFKIIDFILKI